MFIVPDYEAEFVASRINWDDDNLYYFNLRGIKKGKINLPHLFWMLVSIVVGEDPHVHSELKARLEVIKATTPLKVIDESQPTASKDIALVIVVAAYHQAIERLRTNEEIQDLRKSVAEIKKLEGRIRELEGHLESALSLLRSIRTGEENRAKA